MSLDHSFFSKNTGEEVSYFSHNFFFCEGFKHIFGENFDGDMFEVSKEDIVKFVDSLGEIIKHFDFEDHGDSADFNNRTREWVLNETHFITDCGGTLALQTAMLKFPVGFMKQLTYRNGPLFDSIDYAFSKIGYAHYTLTNLLETFDFENDKLLISQAG